MSEWLSLGEVARRLAVSPKTVRNWYLRGKFVKAGVTVQRTLGGHTRFLAADIDRLVQELRGKG